VSFTCIVSAALVATAVVVPADVMAQPTHDVAITSAQACTAAAHGDHRSRPAVPGITYTNPGCRSRGPGAGAGLL
jgi:hypothetical protein